MTVDTMPDLARIGLVGRLVLTTDGTVTPMVEHIVGEPVVNARLVQSYGPVEDDSRHLLGAMDDVEFLSRTTDLVGARSGTVYIRAASVVRPHVLPAAVRAGMLRAEEPIGRLLRAHRVETFRELLTCRVLPNADAFRRYRVFIGGVPALLISETFSTSCLR